MKRWKRVIVLGVLALVAGTVLDARPPAEATIPRVSRYSSVSDLASDVKAHGLGCRHPHRMIRDIPADFAPGGFPLGRMLAESLLCSVHGEGIVLMMDPATYMGGGPVGQAITGQDVRELGVDALLVGPNWVVIPQHEHGLTALSFIRFTLGGRLIMAAPPSPDVQGTPM